MFFRDRPNPQWERDRAELRGEYGLEYDEPVLVTVSRSQTEEDFLFGQLDVFTYSTQLRGVHLQIKRPVRLPAKNEFIESPELPEGSRILPYCQHHFAADNREQGYTLACGAEAVSAALDRLGLSLNEALRMQCRLYATRDSS